uniref:Photosystem I reaction center subunit XI n=2 Tax=Scytosiphon TaxID=27966 RepID=A0A7T8G5L9_SCYLO|nr:photosystem I reaction centre subunit XI [Scytosiphon promiscuus]YP_010147497.1 photosystem I protein L [Scytosiphon lomentaria]QDM58399.1 photosystem I reaction centre subunit XI [Scytosiphon promiscuus]QDM58542.1 photosystem I reaction centre subunit XI [Scytosiphon promiscuus]QQP22309.1 photosystem I protein L [Scytosiphon lomentaria]QTW91504.1 photosystem I subunit XI [Scytosiphon lomentaria]WAM64637.1 Photosystem I reaction centre subunit XI [Scytosiphon lomentaria]
MTSFIKPYNNDPSVGHLSTPVTSSAATKAYLGSLPAYRKGLSPLLRGLEIGMAHGYLLLGPFEKLGPLRESEIALLIGFLSSVGLVTLLTVCLAMYGKVTFQESDNDIINNNDLLNGKNWNQFTSGFFVGSFGGVSFAYLILLNLS